MLVLLVQFSFGCSQKILCLNVLIHRLFWSTVSCSKVRRTDLSIYIAFFIHGVFPLNDTKLVKQEEMGFLLFKMRKYDGILLNS